MGESREGRGLPANAGDLSLADRVLLILREMNRPAWPRAVAAEHERKGWPKPRKSTTYDAVNAAMSYVWGTFLSRLAIGKTMTGRGLWLSISHVMSSVQQ